MVAGLLDHCRTVLRGRRSPARRLLVHNAIATYTCVMVLWHSGQLRVRAEVYVRERDHLLLFSSGHPQGLEVLSLGLDDGNVERWAMVGHTLWIETVDARNIEKPVSFVWSLDLTKAL